MRAASVDFPDPLGPVIAVILPLRQGEAQVEGIIDRIHTGSLPAVGGCHHWGCVWDGDYVFPVLAGPGFQRIVPAILAF